MSSVTGEGGAWSVTAVGWAWSVRVGAFVAGECVRGGGGGVELVGRMVGGGVRVSGGTADPLVCVAGCTTSVTGAGVVTGCVVRTEAGWLGSEEGVAT